MTHLTLRMFPLLLAAVACSDKDGANTPDDGGTTEQPSGEVSVDIVAADGGTVEVGSATLEILPNALTVDTTVTASSAEPDSSLPEFGTLVGLVYDFGPDGTTFDPAAMLTLPLPVTPASGEVAVISWLDVGANAWVDLPTQTAGGDVMAPVDHFTRFVVRIVLGGGGEPGECMFDGACGGDVVGTWTIDSYCLYAAITDTEMPSCVSFTVDADMTGTVTFNGDNTYSSETEISGEIVVTFVDTCLGPITDCSQLSDAQAGSVCTGDVAVSCECRTPLSEADTSMGQWQASGDILSIDEQETGGYPDTGASDSEYCVSGNDLQVYDLDDGTVVQAHR